MSTCSENSTITGCGSKKGACSIQGGGAAGAPLVPVTQQGSNTFSKIYNGKKATGMEQ